MKHKQISAALTAFILASMMLCSCSEQTQVQDNSSSQAESSVSETSSETGYVFETDHKQIEVGDAHYIVYDKPIRFNYVDVPYEDWLSYVSPYDEYVPLLYTDGSGYHDVVDTVAFAIRYAYENGIEELEFPVEYDSMLIMDGWTCAGLSFPSIPMTAGGCDYTLTEEGYYRMRLSESVLKAASHTDEVIAAAKEIVDSIPEDCKTDTEKAYYLYDWVCQNVVYDEYHINGTGMVNNEPQSVYGALVKKRAVCDGIASAVQLLFNMAGIDCGKVDSNGYTYEESGHVWNFAFIGDEVWDFDATWDITNFYESDSDEITTGEMYDYYQWFGSLRRSKYEITNINDNCIYYLPETTDHFSADSPAAISFDVLVNTPPEEDDDFEYIYKGRKRKRFDEKDLKDMLDNKGYVSMKFNDPYAVEWFVWELELTYDPFYDDMDNTELISYLDFENFILELRK